MFIATVVLGVLLAGCFCFRLMPSSLIIPK